MGSCSLRRNKVGGWFDLVGHEFWVWSTLDVGTASLKFRQFKSAVCDAFVVILFLRRLRGCSLLCRGLRGMCWGLGLLCIVGLVGGAWLFGWVRGCWWLIICYVHVFCLHARVRLQRLVVLLGVWSFDLVRM